MKGLYDDLLFPCLSSHNTDTFVYFVCWQSKACLHDPMLCDRCVTRGEVSGLVFAPNKYGLLGTSENGAFLLNLPSHP